MKIKLAEALLRRKELQGKVDMLRVIKDKDLFEVKVNRQNVTESVDNIIAQVPKLSVSEVTKQFDWHARQLRLVDAAIQQANWTSEVEVNDSTMDDFKD
jgi:ABC-type metal ion transport system substrate-binding protein